MEHRDQTARISFGGPLTPTVKTLLWINASVYLCLLIGSGREVFVGGLPLPLQAVALSLLGLVPYSVVKDFAVWQVVTYLFVHVSFLHVLVNMLGLWWFGGEVERYFGPGRFLKYYLVTGIGGALAAIAVGWGSRTTTIGASGAVFGVLLAYAVLFPNRVLYLYFVIPVKAKYAVAAFFLLTVYALISGAQGDVSHIAHFGGLVTGVIWFVGRGLGFRGFKDLWRGFQRSRMRKRLRLIRRVGGDDDGPGTFGNHTVH